MNLADAFTGLAAFVAVAAVIYGWRGYVAQRTKHRRKLQQATVNTFVLLKK